MPHHPPNFESQSIPEPPGPILQEGYPEYNVEEVLAARKRAQEALENARSSMKKHYDKRKEKGRDFEEGEKVWLDAKNLKTYRPGKKLDNKRLGPFTILEKVGNSAYRLQLPKSWNRIHPVFNEILLSPNHPPKFASQSIPEPPGPILQEGYPEYNVE